MAVAAVGQAVVAGQEQTYESIHHQRADTLLEAMMDEIITLPYADPDDASTTLGPEAGETARTLYDDFTRSVTIAASSETITGFSAAISGWTVTITVTDSRGQQWTLASFIPEPAS